MFPHCDLILLADFLRNSMTEFDNFKGGNNEYLI